MYSEIKNNGVLHWSELAAKFDLASHQVKEFLVGFLRVIIKISIKNLLIFDVNIIKISFNDVSIFIQNCHIK